MNMSRILLPLQTNYLLDFVIHFVNTFLALSQWMGSMDSIKNSARNETASTFKVIYQWSRIHWEINILTVSVLEIE